MYKTTILLTTILLLTSCGNNPQQDTIEKQLDSADSIMLIHPDSALHIIENIDISTIKSKRLYARHALLHSQALDKNHIDLKTDSIIRPAIEYYRKKGTDKELGTTYYYLSRIYENNSETEKAIETAIKAKYTLENTDDDNMEGLLYAHLGDLYSYQFNLKEALNMYKTAARHYHSANNPKNELYTHLSQSNVFDFLKQPDSAFHEIKQAESIAIETNDTTILYDVNFYLTSYYTNSKADYNKAKETILYGLDRYKKTPDKNDIFLLSKIYFQLGQNDSALYYLNLYPQTENLNIEEKEKYYALKNYIYKNLDDYVNAYKNLSLYTEATITNKLLQQDKSIKELEQKYQTQLIKQSYQQLHTRHITLCIIATLLLALIILLILIFQKQKRERLNQFYNFHETAKANYASLQERYEELKQELKDKREKSILYTKALDKRMENLQKLLEMTDIYENQTDTFYRKCREYMRLCNGGTQSILNDLQSITTIYYEGFISYLKEHYPALNSDEINLCCMISLNLTTQHIRILFNHTNSKSIYTKRTKLRTKLGIETDRKLDIFLKNLAESTKNTNNQPLENN